MSGAKQRRVLREVREAVDRLRRWQQGTLPNDESRAQVQAYANVLDVIDRRERLARRARKQRVGDA